ncbi:MAG TPA: hypothetical protein PKI10_11915 [Syntrophorhabdus sp.]|nr:hypothetical protein [Syntrophorhabdus sp.]
MRELAVNCDVIPHKFVLQEIISLKPANSILSGIPDTAHGSDALVGELFNSAIGIPVLGICLGLRRRFDRQAGCLPTGNK